MNTRLTLWLWFCRFRCICGNIMENQNIYIAARFCLITQTQETSRWLALWSLILRFHSCRGTPPLECTSSVELPFSVLLDKMHRAKPLLWQSWHWKNCKCNFHGTIDVLIDMIMLLKEAMFVYIVNKVVSLVGQHWSNKLYHGSYFRTLSFMPWTCKIGQFKGWLVDLLVLSEFSYFIEILISEYSFNQFLLMSRKCKWYVYRVKWTRRKMCYLS